MTIKLYEEYKKNLPKVRSDIVVSEYKKEEPKKSHKEIELNFLIGKVIESQALIDRVIPKLDSACSRYVQMLNELLEQKRKNDDSPRYYQKSKPTKTKGSRKQNLKKMYNKIATECHPDKTDDPILHEKFLNAKKAMDNQDEYAIFEIYKEFDDRVSVEDFVNLDQQILEKTIELSTLTNSNSYKISMIYEKGNEKQAKKIYLQTILDQIQKLEAEGWE